MEAVSGNVVINTTFYVSLDLRLKFLAWVREKYLPAAIAEGMCQPRLTRLLMEVHEGAEGYALSLTCTDMEGALAWHDYAGEELRRELSKRFGEKILHFTTFMEELPLIP